MLNMNVERMLRSIKISFSEEESKIKYEEYYFNGLPTPKNIEFKDISSSRFKLFWNIDDVKLLNINNKEIKFKVEIRKENKNEKFIQVYEGNKNNCLVENLNKNTNYEIRICSFYNNITSNWTNIKKVQTSNFESIILHESQREKEFLNKILEWSGYKYMELIYRGTRDGMQSNVFHNKCDNQGPTICLFKNEKNYMFGGYTSLSWTNNGSYKSASDSFIFTLTNMHGTEPKKFNNTNSSYSVCHNSGGPTFGGGHDIYISSDSNNNNSSYSNFPHSYQDSLGKGKSIFTGDLNNNNLYFKMKEVEVFKLFK